MSKKNVIFIHCGNMTTDKYGTVDSSRCQNILNEMVDYMKASNIHESVDAIYLEVVGDSGDINFDIPNTHITYNGPSTQWEFPTLSKLRQFAVDNPDSNILYLHTKGSSVSTNGPYAIYHDEIRQYHLYWTVTHHKLCLDALQTNDVVGAELIYNPVRHFSHNMWWAKASHINTLQSPLDYPMIYDERHQAEFWIGQNNDSKYHSVFNLYEDHVNAISFRKELYENITENRI